MQNSTYSFIDVQAAIEGPGGSFSLSECGIADEGISISHADDKGSMVIGADGCAMHSLHAASGGTVTIRLLKTSPLNALMSSLYNYQTASSALYGQNTIVVNDPVRGDNITCQMAGFRKLPDIAFAKDGGLMEWSFNAGKIDTILGATPGTGNPVQSAPR